MTRILIIGYVWPEPDSSAAGSRMMQLIRLFLGHGWSVTFASAAAASSHMADIESLGVIRAEIELNSRSFDEFVVQLNPDMVLFDRFMIEEQFGWRVAQQRPAALRILPHAFLGLPFGADENHGLSFGRQFEQHPVGFI